MKEDKIIQFSPINNYYAAYKNDDDTYTLNPVLGVGLDNNGNLYYLDSVSDGEITTLCAFNFYIVFHHPLNLQKRFYRKEEVDFLAFGETAEKENG